MTAAPAAPAALYRGRVVHTRTVPVRNRFSRGVFLPLLDLDRLDELRAMWPLWSARRPAIVRHRRSDHGGERRHGPSDPRPLADEVRTLVETRCGIRPEGPVLLLAHARTWGWLFNPLSVYFCHDRAGAPLVAVLEVTSTPWGERDHHVVDLQAGGGRATLPKRIHVSPFLDMDVVYDVHVLPPAERCSIAVTVRRGGDVVLATAMTLHRLRFTRRTLALMLLRHPLMTHRVSAAIHWQALRLWRRGVPVVPRPRAVSGDGRRRPDRAVRA